MEGVSIVLPFLEILLQALSSLISTVAKPIHDLEKTRERIIIQQRVNNEPFLLDETSREQPTEFEIFFCQGKNEYRYYMALLNEEIVSESLYWRAIKIFRYVVAEYGTPW